RGAPNKMFLDIGIIISNLFLSLFGYGIFRIGRNEANKYKAISGIILIAGGIAGILIILLPKDLDSVSAMSVTGYLHHIIAAVLTILAMLSILFSGFGQFHNRKFRIYSIISLILIFIFAVTTVIAGMSKASLVGLFERITLFLYFQWVIIMSGLALKHSVSKKTKQKIAEFSKRIIAKTNQKVPVRMKIVYAVAGILAPLVYTGFVLAGGFLRPDYAPLSHTISTLVQTDAPNKVILRAGFIFSNICLMLFGYGLFSISRNIRKKYRSWSGLALIGAGITGILIIIFPKDPENIRMTLTGFTHHFFIAILAVFVIVSTLFFEFGENHNKKLRNYSKISLYFMLGFALVTVVAGLTGYYYAGLFERISIAAYLQWVLVIAIKQKIESRK
ncbi:MAG: hypothetical protein A2231_05135, partial [Candidatus Firestonebacteria bacterium RIFOXYA2_FULL_40_8]